MIRSHFYRGEPGGMCELLHTQERGLIMKGLNAGASGLRDSNPHPIVESELMPTGQRAAAATSEHRRFFLGQL